MERGLLWLPLLVAFAWLAWVGRKEYQKVEQYRLWAQGFEQAKYDIYAVLGYNQDQITWGKPTSKGMIDLKTLSLKTVSEIRLLVNGQPVTQELPTKGNAHLELIVNESNCSIKIPFTEIDLAAKWTEFLGKKRMELT